ncbi:hypothetical protein WU87_05925 [Corynebacterium minutissimum]|uniref:Uncharacterized protein n=1 Tax=Corynebacterium minutissimum TaxID=38301 RepID=A0ACC4UBG8_9CORY|nr:hypothetical protein WU87_05925 [Corynebacterium minutissimum]
MSNRKGRLTRYGAGEVHNAVASGTHLTADGQIQIDTAVPGHPPLLRRFEATQDTRSNRLPSGGVDEGGGEGDVGKRGPDA